MKKDINCIPVLITIMTTIDLPNNPDFTFIQDNMSRIMISSGYKGVMKGEGWTLLREFTGKSFMFSDNTEINHIMDNVNNEYSGGHSGSSIGWTMRQLERISHVGMNTFKREWLQNTSQMPVSQ